MSHPVAIVNPSPRVSMPFRAVMRRPVFGRRRKAGPSPAASGITAQDVKDFLMAYCACFMAVIGFFA